MRVLRCIIREQTTSQFFLSRAVQVIVYMKHHKGVEGPLIEKPLRSRFMIDAVKDPWDAKFIDDLGENRQDLYDLMLAANYMDMQRLLYICAAKVATLVKGQPLDKIKSVLAVKPEPEGKEEEKPEGKEEEKPEGKEEKRRSPPGRKKSKEEKEEEKPEGKEEKALTPPRATKKARKGSRQR